MAGGHSFGKKVYFLELFLRTDRDVAMAIAEYNAVIRDVCTSGSYTLIPTADVICATDLLDGCHPNAMGHAKLCTRVAEYMTE